MRILFFKPLLSILITILLIANSLNLKAQFQFHVTQCQTVGEVIALIDTVFLAGVNPQAIANVSFTGDPTAVGYFTNAYFAGFHTPTGIIMTSGHAGDADNSNICNSGANASTNNNGPDNEPDLSIASNGGDVHDACVIEFDFKPTADTVRFSYVFASEEYHDFVFSYNDVFGFFLSGDGLSGPYSNNGVNIAIIPGTNLPVTINNVNFGKGGVTCTGIPNGCTNCAYMRDNSEQSNPAFYQFVYDGYTAALTAKSAVTHCDWYHIKIAISDIGDAAFDSGVLLEKGSFNPGNVTELTDYTHPTIDSLVYESCNNHDAILYYTIDEPMGYPYIIPFTVAGSAERDVDYKLTSTHLGDTIYIPVGQTYDSLIIMPYADNIVEGIEDVEILYNSQMCNVFGQNDTSFVYISDNPNFTDTSMRFPVFCEDTALIGFDAVLNGVPPYSYNWYTLGDTTPSVNYSPSGTDSVMIPVIVLDTCGHQVSDTAFVFVPQLVADAGVDQSLCNQPGDSLHGSSPGAQFFHWVSNPTDPSLAGQENLQEPYVSPTVATKYSLTVSDNCTHSDTDTTHILMNQAIANAGEDTEICKGDTVVLSCNDGAAFLWTANPADPSLGTQDTLKILQVAPQQTTIYTVTVTNACGYSATDDVKVVVHDLPLANAGSDQHVCKGMSYGLSASGGLLYHWTSNPYDPSLYANGQDTLSNPIVTPDVQTTYTVTVANEYCSAKDSMVLTVDPVPDLSLSTLSDSLCFADTTVISVIGNAEYSWTSQPDDPNLAGQIHNQSITISPDTTTVYTLTGIVNGFNCPATLHQTVFVKPKLFANFTTSGNDVCQSEPFVVDYTGNAGDNANYVFDWSQQGTLTGSGQGPYTITFDSSGIQNIQLTVTENGCSSQPYQQTVTVHRVPQTNFSSDITEDCQPLTVHFQNQSSNLSGQTTYEWNFGTGDNNNEKNPNYTYNLPGNYTVSLKVTNDALCYNTKTYTDYVKVHEIPTADFTPQPALTVLEDATINFSNQTSGQEQWSSKWSFGDGDTSDLASPKHTYTATGTYNVLLTVTSTFGCINQVSKEVIIQPDFAAYAPTSFTPNGDGLNDKFEVKGVGIKKFKLQIYSRWGELVFESNNIEDEWDGTYKGKLVPRGSYVYHVYYTTFLNRNLEKEGTVTVLH